MYGFEWRGNDAPLIRCDPQSGEHWGQVIIDVPWLVKIEACLSPGFLVSGFYIFEGIENESAVEKLLLKRASLRLIAGWLIFLQETAVAMVSFPGSRYARAPVPHAVFPVAGFFDF